jgi:hypothetical protein
LTAVSQLWALTEVLSQVRKTMKAIRHTLIERWYAFESARQNAMTDPQIDLYAQPGSTGLVERNNERKVKKPDPVIIRRAR